MACIDVVGGPVKLYVCSMMMRLWVEFMATWYCMVIGKFETTCDTCSFLLYITLNYWEHQPKRNTRPFLIVTQESILTETIKPISLWMFSRTQIETCKLELDHSMNTPSTTIQSETSTTWCLWFATFLQCAGCMSALPNINALSESEGDDDDVPPPPLPFHAVAQLSDSDGGEVDDLPPQKWRRKRTLKQKEETAKAFRCKLNGETFVRAMIGKKCIRCRHHCMEKFSTNERFAQLVAFRKDWTGFDKLDQDRIVSQRSLWWIFFLVLVLQLVAEWFSIIFLEQISCLRFNLRLFSASRTSSQMPVLKGQLLNGCSWECRCANAPGSAYMA